MRAVSPEMLHLLDAVTSRATSEIAGCGRSWVTVTRFGTRHMTEVPIVPQAAPRAVFPGRPRTLGQWGSGRDRALQRGGRHEGTGTAIAHMYERTAYDVTSDEAAADPARVRGARAAGALPRGASDAGAAPGTGRDPTVLYVRQPRTWVAPFLHLPSVRPDGLRPAAHIGVRVHRHGWPRNPETLIRWLAFTMKPSLTCAIGARCTSSRRGTRA